MMLDEIGKRKGGNQDQTQQPLSQGERKVVKLSEDLEKKINSLASHRLGDSFKSSK